MQILRKLPMMKLVVSTIGGLRYDVILGVMCLCVTMFFWACDTPAPPNPTQDPIEVVDPDDPADPAEPEEEDVPRPEGWGEDTHGKKADPNYDVVFDGDSVKRLDITFTREDWQIMIDSMSELFGDRDGSWASLFRRPMGFPDENPEWRPCMMKFEGKTWYHVGFRFKGNSSLRSSWQAGSNKLPFRLNLDKFEDDYPAIKNQRFYGFDEMAMSSNYSDSSFIREKVVADIFRDAGVPAPHTAFYRVFIDIGDGQGLKYHGLYTMCEIPDKPFLESQFSDNGGNLYKPSGTGATFATYDEASYDKETNEKEADFSDVRALYDALNASRGNAAVWRQNLEQVFNVDGFLRWLAVNTVIVSWDTYGQMPQNYFLYNDPADTQLHWIPWDHNMAMSSGGRRALSLYLTRNEVSSQWPLIRYLIDDPVYWEKYVGHVRYAIENVFYPARIKPIFNAAHELVRPYVVGAQGEVPGYTMLRSASSFEQAIGYLNDHVDTRYQVTMDFLDEVEN